MCRGTINERGRRVSGAVVTKEDACIGGSSNSRGCRVSGAVVME